MSYFLRFTNTPEADLERGTSLHLSDFRKGEIKKSKLAEMFGCEKSDIVVYEGLLCQSLDGLCGYELEADNLGDAIDEVNEGKFQFADIGKAVIYKGVTSSDTDMIPDGDLFTPISIEKIL